jgi:hypothetical protein
VAAQALRRIAAASGDGVPPGTGTVEVLLNGVVAALPDVALAYPQGTALAPTPATA